MPNEVLDEIYLGEADKLVNEYAESDQGILSRVSGFLVGSGRVAACRCVRLSPMFRSQSRRNWRQFKRSQISDSLFELREANILPSKLSIEWLLIRWIVIPFIMRLLFGEE